GEGEGEPDGDCVDDDGEVDVEPHEDSPHVGKLVLKWSRFLDQENKVNAKNAQKSFNKFLGLQLGVCKPNSFSRTFPSFVRGAV
ncbi:MAG: hypothetical protein ACK56I_32520, partial [bacterium]